MKGARPVAVVILLSVALASGFCQETGGGTPAYRFVANDRTRLLRIAPDSERPCLSLALSIVDGAGNPLPLSTTDLESQIERNLRITEGSHPIERFAVSVEGKDLTNGVPYRTFTIILVDHSGSMFTDVTEEGTRKFDAALAACRQFANDFRDGIDNAAVIPFSSHAVVSTVQHTPFRSRRLDLLRQIDQCHTWIGNTALYTAMSAAIDRLQKTRDSVQAEDSVEPRCLLVVLTDGQNRVNPQEDDPGLSKDWREVVARESRAGIQIITIGFGKEGDFDEEVLKRLAWPDASSYRKASFGSDLIPAFVAARKFLLYRIRVLFLPLEESRSQFVTQQSFSVELRVDKPRFSIQGSFTFPQEAPGRIAPPFERQITDAERGLLFSRGPVETVPFGPSYALIVGACSALFLVLWFVVPRLRWRKDREAPGLWKDVQDILRDR